MCITEIGAVAVEKSNVLSVFENLVHGFTTRKGGVSKGEYESLSMSPWRGDDIECVHKNEEILCKSMNVPLENLTATKQEHTDVVEIIDEPHVGYGIKESWGKGVDGCITTLKNVPLLCYSADCVPVLIYASDIEAIAAVHAGWRGTEKGIVKKTIEKIISLGAESKNIYVAIGPCIHKCCYEVGGDVAGNFSEKYYDSIPNGKYMLDLSAVNYDYAVNCDVPKENISISAYCTKCNNELFFSHRGQNGKSGTLAGIICMRD